MNRISAALAVLLLAGCAAPVLYGFSSDGRVTRDDWVHIKWVPTPQSIGMVVRNKTDQTLRIDWDASAVIDADGVAHRVVHHGVLYANRDRPQAPSPVPGGAAADEVVIPADRVGRFGIDALLPETDQGTSIENLKRYVGRSIRVVLAVTKGDEHREYLAAFAINHVAVDRRRPRSYGD